MSLDLDARQRAMLQEMGVQVWWPAPTQAAPDKAVAAPAPAATASVAQPPAVSAQAARTPPHHTAPTVQHAGPVPVRTALPAVPPATLLPVDSGGTATALWSLGAPQPLFAQADPARTPADLGAGWLLVAEDTGDIDPFAGDAGLLLRNMLHALRLHHHPRVFLCALQVPGPADPAMATDTAPCAQALAAAVASVQPGVVLLMGRAAARAALGRSEPLGQLRATPHTVAGVPAVVTYGTPYLLRAPPATKAQAWADLCRARALATGEGAAAQD